MANRLANATSPYLQQHAGNPVDWWEWGPEAFEEARRRDAPVLLSVGYAACHWCHVMAHESFEDEATAALMNERFVNIKVDREERPDIDAVYMQATVALTGQGGWPMTVFVDHEGRPFFAGTYFPPTPRHGQSSFQQLLGAIDEAWQERRGDVLDAADRIRGHLGNDPALEGAGVVGSDLLAAAVRALASAFDGQHAGFGGAPKFPPSMLLEFLLRHAASGVETSDVALRMVASTCEAMARGGLYDQLGGGFARYSVDPGWVVPHFEKMLYDNAQLLSAYAGLYAATGDPLAERVVRETVAFVVRELRTPEGAFASALDADTDGVEGAFYAWTPAELVEVLGEEDGAWAASLSSVTPEGTFEHGSSTLQLRTDPDDVARWESVRGRLFEARARRTHPARDDKVVAVWNGLMIGALARAGMVLGEPEWIDLAVSAADLVWRVHWVDGRLRRASRDGLAGNPAGVLDDYGCLADGFISLVEATGDARWLERAGSLLSVARQEFAADDGGFHDTASDAEQLITRPRDPSDNASPSGQAALAHALVRWSALTGDTDARATAEAALATVRRLVERAPRFAGWSLATAELLAAGPREIAVVGPAGPERDALESVARRAASAVTVVAEGPDSAIPLLADRTPLEGRATAYVCRGMVCDRPVTTVGELEELLRA